MQTAAIIIGFVALLLSLVTTLHLMLFYRRATTAVAWLFAIWVLPLLGVLAYLAFAVYQGPRKLRRRRAFSRQLRSTSLRLQSSLPEHDYARQFATKRFAHLMDKVQPLPLTAGNCLHLHAGPEEAARDMIDAIRGAQSEVFVETYILDVRQTMSSAAGDLALKTVEDFLQALRERAAAGVDVRLVYDAIGSHKLAARVIRDLRAHGVRIGSYMPVHPLKGRFQINFRNHRKILLVDHRIAWTGGRNWQDRYFSEAEGGIRDLSLRVQGPAVQAVRRVFLEDWAVSQGQDVSQGKDLGADALETSAVEFSGEQLVRVVPCGLDEASDVLLAMILAAFCAAQREILVVTPYFVPGTTVLAALRNVALGGVRVRLLMPEETPEKSPQWASRRYFEELLDAGVEIWLRPKPFLHAKAILIDGCWATLGSANFDNRSFHLNYELNLEVADKGFVEELAQYFEADFAVARRVDAESFRKRPLWRRAIENAAALFEPEL